LTAVQFIASIEHEANIVNNSTLSAPHNHLTELTWGGMTVMRGIPITAATDVIIYITLRCMRQVLDLEWILDG
tara:strand:- start:2561 stop:2779 length:219 start_codon:yes stop_codon:yes gene_type:complete